MKKNLIALALFTFVLTNLACGISTPSEPIPTLNQADIETLVAATLENSEPTFSLPIESTPIPPTEAPPTQDPTQEPTPEPTIPPACQPAHPGAQILPPPVGFASGVNTLAVEFFDNVGVPFGNIQTPGMTWTDPGQIHIGGPLSQGLANISLVYHSLENGGILKRSEQGIANHLAQSPNLVTLAGGEGTSAITYSTNDSDQAAGGWVSYLYAGDLEAINGAQPMLTRSEGDGLVIYPLAVRVVNGVGEGVWFTLSMWGIGNINFAPFNGLYYFNFFDRQVTEYLPNTDRLAGFSPDQTMVAYLPGVGAQPGGPGINLTLRDLVTCQETVIPFNANTNLGGGFVSFSPDQQYLAWLEASGPNNMEAQMRLRVAKSNGDILRDAQLQELNGLAGGEVPVYIRPVGWLANHLLLLEIGVNSQVSPMIVVWAPDSLQPLDPALGANQSTVLADGVFAGFIYP